MYYTSFTDTLFLTANICALLATYMLFFKFYSYRKFPNQLLGSFLAVNIYCNATYLLIITGWIQQVPALYKVAAPITYLIGPLGFLYVRAVLNNETRFKKIDLIHLIPFLIFLVNYLPFYFIGLDEKREIVTAIVDSPALIYILKDGLLPEWVNIFCRALLSVVYLILQWRLVFVFYKSSSKKTLLPQTQVLKKWVVMFTGIVSFFYLSLLIFYILVANNIINSENIIPKHPHTLSVVVIVYLIAVSYFSFGSYILINSHQLFGTTPSLFVSKLFNQKNRIPEGLTPQKIKFYIEKLEHYFYNKKPYLNTKLTINKVSMVLEISTKNLSYILNNQFHQRFTEYINVYRINYVLQKIDTDYLKKVTLETLSKEAGFGSRSAFNMAFKNVKGSTPSEYLKNIKS